MKRLILTSLCVVLVCGTAVADWEPTDPAKWVQLPDLDPITGMDVYATSPKVLADDFLCTQPELITDIHIWGSWYGDDLNTGPTGGNPYASDVTFTLSIHSDIPAGSGGPGYSMPGESLWEQTFGPGQFSLNLYSTGPQGWYNPNTGEYIVESDYEAWQYNFYIDPAEAFQQEGTPDTPIVYWLDVSATPTDGLALFGWKTSMMHWNDDAVWGDSHQGPWNELRYPDGHPFAGVSIDLAFVITPEPATVFLLGLGAFLIRRRKR